MLGVIVNTVAVILGGIIGTLCKKGISEKISKSIMTGVALCILIIGISGALKSEKTLVMIVAVVLGAIVGTLIDIDKWLNVFGVWIEKKFSKKSGVSIAQGFVTGSLLFCIGSMAVVGSLNAGLLHDNQMLYIKSLLDAVLAIMLATTLGIGVAFSGFCVFALQGSIVLLSGLLKNVLSDAAISEMSCVGSLLIVALGLNMLGIPKIKVANYMPAIIFAPILGWAVGLLPFSI